MIKTLSEELNELIGATITQAEVVASDGDNWPVLILAHPSGKMIQIEILRDNEGNGPGCLFMSEVK
jgi:hypothetical protein